MLRALDGARPLCEVAGEEALPVVRRLLELGFVLPA